MDKLKWDISFGEKVILATMLYCMALDVAIGAHGVRQIQSALDSVHSQVCANRISINKVTKLALALKDDIHAYERACASGRPWRIVVRKADLKQGN